MPLCVVCAVQQGTVVATVIDDPVVTIIQLRLRLDGMVTGVGPFTLLDDEKKLAHVGGRG